MLGQTPYCDPNMTLPASSVGAGGSPASVDGLLAALFSGPGLGPDGLYLTDPATGEPVGITDAWPWWAWGALGLMVGIAIGRRRRSK